MIMMQEKYVPMRGVSEEGGCMSETTFMKKVRDMRIVINENTWQDEICEVIEGPPSDLQSKGDIKKCLRATGVVLFISRRRKTQQVPFPISSILRQFSLGIYEFNVELVSLVGPTAKFHIALLIVERKPGDIDLAC